MKPIWYYCPMKDSNECGGTCSQENMPDCPYLKYAIIQIGLYLAEEK